MHSEAAPWLQGLGTGHEGPPRLAQPFENTVFQRRTGFLIIRSTKRAGEKKAAASWS